MSRVLVLLVLLLPILATASQAQDYLLGARTKGSASAPVTVYEMSDFQCPFCREHAIETFPALERAFITAGKVRWIFINFPLTDIHPNAAAAAEFAMCGAKAGKFWSIHDLLFKYQDKWAPLKEPGPFLITLADSVGLERNAITPCLEKGEMRALIQADAESASRSGAASTPSFYIEGGMLVGAQTPESFTAVLDSIYQAKTGQ